MHDGDGYASTDGARTHMQARMAVAPDGTACQVIGTSAHTPLDARKRRRRRGAAASIGCKERAPVKRQAADAPTKGNRIGEASNPVPAISMPSDGNFMFLSLAYWATQDQRQVSGTVAKGAISHWGALFRWDERQTLGGCKYGKRNPDISRGRPDGPDRGQWTLVDNSVRCKAWGPL